MAQARRGLASLSWACVGEMVSAGINPAGTKASVATYNNASWWRFFDRPTARMETRSRQARARPASEYYTSN